MEFTTYVFKNRLTGEYWICRGATTPDKNKATKFNEQQAARFLRTVKYQHKWIKELF